MCEIKDTDDVLAVKDGMQCRAVAVVALNFAQFMLPTYGNRQVKSSHYWSLSKRKFCSARKVLIGGKQPFRFFVGEKSTQRFSTNSGRLLPVANYSQNRKIKRISPLKNLDDF